MARDNKGRTNVQGEFADSGGTIAEEDVNSPFHARIQAAQNVKKKTDPMSIAGPVLDVGAGVTAGIVAENPLTGYQAYKAMKALRTGIQEGDAASAADGAIGAYAVTSGVGKAVDAAEAAEVTRVGEQVAAEGLESVKTTEDLDLYEKFKGTEGAVHDALRAPEGGMGESEEDIRRNERRQKYRSKFRRFSDKKKEATSKRGKRKT